jgi:hypothetical protein
MRRCHYRVTREFVMLRDEGSLESAHASRFETRVSPAASGTDAELQEPDESGQQRLAEGL